jgi:hypothetical protein
MGTATTGTGSSTPSRALRQTYRASSIGHQRKGIHRSGAIRLACVLFYCFSVAFVSAVVLLMVKYPVKPP